MTERFLSCDWGTSSFRLRLINAEDCSVMAEIVNGKGIAMVYEDWKQSGLPGSGRIDFYKKILLAEIKKLGNFSLNELPMVISGMASSSIGIIEIPYANIPFDLKASDLNIQKIQPDEKFPDEILIVSGLRSENDVMRGEETILLGCETNGDGQLIILPGTHSKHVVIEKGMVKDVKTFMTGELFDLLATKSILSASVEKKEVSESGRRAFIKGIHESASSNLLNNIFRVRTNHLFGKMSKPENYHYLSGLLVGEELKDISKRNFSTVTVVSSGILQTLYKEALSAMGFGDRLRVQDADQALIKGHSRILDHYQ